MKPKTNDKYLPGHAALLVANIIFGLNLPVSKALLSSGVVSSFALNMFRLTGAALLFWIVSLFVKREKVSPRDILLLFFASVFGIQLNQVAFLKGLSMTAPIDAAIIAALVPIFTMIFAAMYLKEPVTWKKTLGVLVGAAGATMLILGAHGNGAEASPVGDMFCLLSSVSFAIYLVVFRDLIRRYTSVTLMKWMFLFAAVCTAPITWGDVAAIDPSLMTGKAILEVFYVVVAATFITYLIVPVGQRMLRPTVVSMYNYVQPLVAVLVAVVLGLEAFSWEKILAGSLVFLGVYIVTLSKSRDQMETQRPSMQREGDSGAK